MRRKISFLRSIDQDIEKGFMMLLFRIFLVARRFLNIRRRPGFKEA